MHWSIASLAEAGTAATIKKMKGFSKDIQIRGVMAILILISLIFVAVQSAFLLHRLDRLNERLGPMQEKSLDLYVEPWYPYWEERVPIFNHEEEGEIPI